MSDLQKYDYTRQGMFKRPRNEGDGGYYKADDADASLAARDQRIAELEGLLRDVDLYRQWFNAVQDLNPGYLESHDYQAAMRLYEFLGVRVPTSMQDAGQQAEPYEYLPEGIAQAAEQGPFIDPVELARAATPSEDGGEVLAYQLQSREIGESDWAPCDHGWYLYCQKSPEHDTRVVELSVALAPAAVVMPEYERNHVGLIAQSALNPWNAALDEVAILNAHPITAAELEALRRDAATTQAARDVLAERQRQVDTEGWTPEHDDKHGAGELADAAACYALWAGGINPGNWREFWPWAPEWLKHSEPRRMLVKAGALIQAEIERLDRAANKEPSHG